MDRPIRFPARLEEELLRLMLDQLPETGSVEHRADELTVPVKTWRAVARRAGRQLGRPIITLEAGPMVIASLRDWPATLPEQRRRDQRMHKIADAMDRSWSTPDPAPWRPHRGATTANVTPLRAGVDDAAETVIDEAPLEGSEGWLSTAGPSSSPWTEHLERTQTDIRKIIGTNLSLVDGGFCSRSIGGWPQRDAEFGSQLPRRGVDRIRLLDRLGGGDDRRSSRRL